MKAYELLGRSIANEIDAIVEDFGHVPNEFYRENNLYFRIRRIRKGESFTSHSIKEIVNLAESLRIGPQADLERSA